MYKAYANNDPSTCKQAPTTFIKKISYRKEELLKKKTQNAN